MTSSQACGRRQFLKGAGLSLALPFFESRAVAASQTVRPKKILAIGNHLGFYPGAFFPKEEGVDYVPSPTLKNIEKHRKGFTVFSHLDHDVGGGHAGVNAFLCGVRKQESNGFPEKNASLTRLRPNTLEVLPAFHPLRQESGKVRICAGRARVCVFLPSTVQPVCSTLCLRSPPDRA